MELHAYLSTSRHGIVFNHGAVPSALKRETRFPHVASTH